MPEADQRHLRYSAPMAFQRRCAVRVLMVVLMSLLKLMLELMVVQMGLAGRMLELMTSRTDFDELEMRIVQKACSAGWGLLTAVDSH